MKYDIAIAHRVCPTLAKTAVGFDDKFNMVRATTVSLAKAIRGLNVKLAVVLDGCPDEYAQLFDVTFKDVENVDYERLSTPSIGNHATYAKQLELLSSFSTLSEYLYFSEDDYIYKENAFVVMMDFLKQPDVDFVTPLDHPDGYQREREGALLGRIRVSSYCHWRDIASTCCTFMMKSAILSKAAPSLAYYAHGGSDYIMWILLTKKTTFSPLTVVGGVFDYFGTRNWMNLIPVIAWVKLGMRLLLRPRFSLWSPMPTLSVHLCRPSLPPLGECIFTN